MRKGETKAHLSITIDKELLRIFKQYCKNRLIKTSTQIEKLISDFMRDKK